MSDLSRLLDDVYRSGSSLPAAPAWSSDSALDEVFSDWVPGEQAEAPVDEAYAPVSEPAPLTMTSETMEQLDALVAAAVAMAPAADEQVDESEGIEIAVPPAPVAVENRDAALRWTPERSPDAGVPIPPLPAVTPWSRHDDDILPRRGLGGRRRGLSLRRR